MTLSALAVSWTLVLAIVFRYPGNAYSRGSHLWFLCFASIALLIAAAAVVSIEYWRDVPEDPNDASLGIQAGLICGGIWIIEIGFNNFADPNISTDSARRFVDNGAWGLIALFIFVVSAARTWKTKEFSSAIRVGLYSGIISGSLACLMGLLLVALWMPFLLRDPMNIQEYAARNTTEHADSISTYLAYETMSGALLHLIVLGLIMGLFLGAVGGMLGLAMHWFPPTLIPLKAGSLTQKGRQVRHYHSMESSALCTIDRLLRLTSSEEQGTVYAEHNTGF
jgi:hypothetical protein